jgi:carbamoyl-phosphate synthase/aspartate carbamoyltransferase/dihydroorotase
MIRLPGLIDVHVHVREPGGTHKEDWDSGTCAALAGGFTTILSMPNTRPPVTDEETLKLAISTAKTKARCDYAQFLGAGPDNLQKIKKIGPKSAGLKMYLDQTYGPLRLDDMTLWMEHFKNWPRQLPIVAHAEGRTMAAVILLAAVYQRSLHLAHVSLKEEILLIRAAKEKGIKITCEATPHHLFLSDVDAVAIGPGRSEVRPRLATKTDQQALWDNLEVIDVFATDHAPHTLGEKDGENPPPGFPGLESALPLYLTAVYEDRLSIDTLVVKTVNNPRKIFSIPEQKDTWVEINENEEWIIRGKDTFTRCAWSPFEGRKVRGRVIRVVLRGKTAYSDGKILAVPGSGRNIRQFRQEKTS